MIPEVCPECDYDNLHGPSHDDYGVSCPDCGWYDPDPMNVMEEKKEKPKTEKKPAAFMNQMQLAEYLGVHYTTVHRWRKAGKISFYKFGGKVMFSMRRHVRPFLHKYEKQKTR